MGESHNIGDTIELNTNITKGAFIAGGSAWGVGVLASLFFGHTRNGDYLYSLMYLGPAAGFALLIAGIAASGGGGTAMLIISGCTFLGGVILPLAMLGPEERRRLATQPFPMKPVKYRRLVTMEKILAEIEELN